MLLPLFLPSLHSAAIPYLTIFTIKEQIFSFSLIFFPVCQKVFITNFVMRVTNFLIYVTNFVICVTNFVTNSFCAEREKCEADRKNLLWATINYLLDACPSHISYIRKERRSFIFPHYRECKSVLCISPTYLQNKISVGQNYPICYKIVSNCA